jgi:POT family proton-dependent oligopeptide transporter
MKGFFGHPRGLATLFMTELWERFSYYGIRALLILFMTAGAAAGGLGFDVARASAIYGLYTAMVYMLSLPGGWVADRILGLRRSVLWGGVLIALGNFTLAVPQLTFFYLGLAVIAVGTGLLKPNVSAIVGQLYERGDARRDAGFSIFYMGINLGAFLAPLACGYLGQRVNWRLGFLLAGIGMTLGLIQFVAGWKHLGTAGAAPAAPDPQAKTWLGWGLAAVAAVAAVAALAGLTVEALSNALGFALLLTALGFFFWLFFLGRWTAEERKRLFVVGVLFLASALFWSLFEQAGSTLNLFAERSTRKSIVGWSFPASWFQSVNAVFIITLAPVFAWIWVKLGRNEPSSPAKFGLGLAGAGGGFLLLGAAAASSGGQEVSPLWLVAVYLLHTVGELCLSPVGLSAMTKLAPARIGGLLMGAWFLSISAGNYLGARLASLYETWALPTLFNTVGVFGVGAAVLLWLFVQPIQRLMGDTK